MFQSFIFNITKRTRIYLETKSIFKKLFRMIIFVNNFKVCFLHLHFIQGENIVNTFPCSGDVFGLTLRIGLLCYFIVFPRCAQLTELSPDYFV